MDDVRWQRAKQVFHEALEKTGPARARFVAAACGEDDELRAQVNTLLAAHAEAGEFMASPTGPGGDEVAKGVAAVAAAAPPEGPGTRIGPYKLLQSIGEGGFGVVYMAEQEHPIRRRVALKIIKLGMDTREVIARFEAERQALALMDHPGIAKVLDAGATESGRPYFVMELVRGVPITEYCDANRSTTRERLELFMDVCRAIHHAHEKGIVHRDIKPSNVLVTLHDGTPVAKVIDFGIAKAMNQPLTEKTLFTAYGEFAGTPAYMSPEQAALGGLEIDRRCDVYALGVLLYELLTGTTPFEAERLRSRAFLEIMRIIRDEDPPTPSARLSTLGDRLAEVASRRQVEPYALAKLVRGDLDWIVTRALEKDRRRRYDSAVALADDVARHFRHEPVVARRPSAACRVQKFARRRRGTLAAAAAIAVAVALGGTIPQMGGFASSRSDRADPPGRRLINGALSYHSGLPTRDGRHLLRYSPERRGYELVEIASGRVRSLTRGGPDPDRWMHQSLDLSPDQRRIAAVYSAKGDAGSRPGVMSDSGPELRIFTVGEEGEGRVVRRWPPGHRYFVFAWSPERDRIWVYGGMGELEISSVSIADGSVEVLRTVRRKTTQWPSLSPDGRFIAYHDVVEAGQPSDMFLVATDGSQDVRVEHPAADRKPLFTPDGAGIVFQSNREGGDLWFLPVVDGRPAGAARPVWDGVEPYGQALHFGENGSLFHAFGTGNWEVYTVDIDLAGSVVGEPRLIPPRRGEINNATAFSPDGRLLAHVRDRGRRLVLRELATGSEREFPIAGILVAPALDFCPDGRSVIVSGAGAESLVFRVDLDRGGARRLPIDPVPVTSVLCVGDGDDLVYVDALDDRGSRVVRRSLVTGAETVLYESAASRLELVRSPDGSQVAIRTLPRMGSEVAGEAQLAAMPSNGGRVVTIPGPWMRIHGVMWLPDGRELLVVRESDGQAPGATSPEVTLLRVPIDGAPPSELGRMRLPAFEHAIYGSGAYSLHPHGSQIAFERHGGYVEQVWAIDNLLAFIRSGGSVPPGPRR